MKAGEAKLRPIWRVLQCELSILTCCFVGVGKIECALAVQLVPQASVQLTTYDDGLSYIEGLTVAADGHKVLFVASPDRSTAPPPSRFYEVGVDGGPIVQRTFEPDTSREDVEGWIVSPDGKLIVYRQSDHGAYGDLFALPVSSGLPRRLTFDDNVRNNLNSARFFFTPDGRQVIYGGEAATNHIELYRVPVNGSALPQRINPVLSGSFTVPDNWILAPDGEHVLYESVLNSSRLDLYSLSLRSGELKQLNETPSKWWSFDYLRFSVDEAGQYVVYKTKDSQNSPTAGWLRSLNGGPERELTTGLAQHSAMNITALAFFGRHVMFEANATSPGNYEWFFAPIDNGERKRLSTLSPVAGAPVRLLRNSPDGQSIVFNVQNSSTEASVFYANIDTLEVQLLGTYQDASKDQFPSVQFSEDGAYFLIGGDGFHRTLFTGSGSIIRTLDITTAESFRFHPSGEYILYTDYETDPSPRRTQIYLERIDGVGKRIRLSTDTGTLSAEWFSIFDDGATVLYTRRSNPFDPSVHTLHAVRLTVVPEPLVRYLVAIALGGFQLSVQRRRVAVRFNT